MNAQSQTLIPTVSGSLNGENQTLVNARELHEFLCVGTRFDKWIKNRISEYQFTQDVDFIECPNLTNRGFWQTETSEYHLSLDMAKELCMVERNEKGRQARRYFIEMEKQARQQADFSQSWLLDELQDEFYKANPKMLKLALYHAKGLNHQEIGKLLDVSTSTVCRYLKRLSRLGLIDYTPNAKMVALGKKSYQAMSPKRQFLAAQQPLGLED